MVETHEGGCTCGAVRYRMTSAPMFVHCCHCRWCRRETGSAFGINALIEADRVHLLQGELEVVDTPSQSGRGQRIVRCAKCRVAVWSHYAGAGGAVDFVRVGTLDEPCRPTSTSTPNPGNPGSCSRPAHRRSRSTTTCRRCGRPKAWPGARR